MWQKESMQLICCICIIRLLLTLFLSRSLSLSSNRSKINKIIPRRVYIDWHDYLLPHFLFLTYMHIIENHRIKVAKRPIIFVHFWNIYWTMTLIRFVSIQTSLDSSIIIVITSTVGAFTFLNFDIETEKLIL